MSNRVYRGGSWWSSARSCRSAYRGRSLPALLDDLLGFRLVYELPPCAVRGGSWLYPARRCRSSCRFRSNPSYRSLNLGFRVVYE